MKHIINMCSVKSENNNKMYARCTQQSDKEFLVELLLLYRKLRSLWKVKSKQYKDAKLKEKQFEILLTKYKERYPDANKVKLKKKINSLRSNYRREKFRVEKLNKNRKHVDVMGITIPTLWYYNYISFLDVNDESNADAENDDKSETSCEIEESENQDEIKYVDTLEYLEAQSLHSTIHNAGATVEVQLTEQDTKDENQDSVRKKQKLIDVSECLNSQNFQPLIPNETATVTANVDTQQREEDKVNETEEPSRNNTQKIVESPLMLSAQSLKEQSDNIEKLTNLWAAKLKQMSSSQQLYAEKFIHEILFEGILGNLNRNSVQINTANATSPSSIVKLNRPLLGFLYESSNTARHTVN